MAQRVKNSFRYLSQFLILVGVVMVSAVVFSGMGTVLGMIIFGLSAEDSLDIVNSLGMTNTQLNLLKFTTAVASIGTFLIPGIFAPTIFSENTSKYLNIKKPNYKYLGLATLLAVVLLPFNSLLIQLGEYLETFVTWDTLISLQSKTMDTMEKLLNMSSTTDYLVGLLIVAAIPAIGEEFLFRGAFLSLFNKWFKNIHAAIIVQALLFGALHLQVANFIAITTIGIILGYIIYLTKSIWVSVLLHFVNNAMAVTAMYFQKDGGAWEQLLNDNFPVYISLISLILSAGIFYLIWKNRIKEKQITIEIE